MIRPHALSPGAVPSGALSLGTMPSSQTLTLGVALPPANQAALSSLLAAQQNPESPEYHRWLTPTEFRSEFSPSSGDVEAVTSWLRSDGFTPTVSGYLVSISAPEEKVAQAWGTSFTRYRLAGGRTGYVASAPPLVPANLAGGQITSILGLNTTYQFNPQDFAGPKGTSSESAQAVVPAADGLSPCTSAQNETTVSTGIGVPNYTLDQVGSDYGIGSLLSAGQTGTGETIGVYELARSSATDISTYKSCFGLTNAFSVHNVDGGGPIGINGTFEADLDAEQAMTQSPGASVISFEGPNTPAGNYDVFKAMVSNTAVDVISTSWGLCEPLQATEGFSSYNTLFAEAAAQGQTVLAASGDQGTEGCLSSDGSTAAEVSYPASDVNVTAVGGTTLDTNSPSDQTAWNWCQSNESNSCASSFNDVGAGGGGMSRYEATRPTNQPNVLQWTTSQPCGTQCRELPDISANAGALMVVYAGGSWSLGAGTSFAAPFIGGLVADVDSSCGSMGVLTPLLYSLYDQGSYNTAFTDVTSGNIDLTGSNGGRYAAQSGYDTATGIGTPIAAGLTCTSLSSVSPSHAVAGTQVTVNGLGLEHATIDFGSSPATVVSATATSATVVVPPGSGTVTVSATGNSGSTSHTASFTYDTPPGAFSITTATPSPDQVAVSWANSTSATSYAVYDATSTGGENTSGATACTATAPTTTCTVSGLTNGTTYFFVVVASNSTSTTQSTNEMSATPESTPPGSFAITTATPSPGQVAVSWGTSTNAASYAVYDATSTGGENTSGATACTATAPTTTCTVNGLTNGTTYFFVVVASNSSGTTPSTNEMSATPESTPPGSFAITTATSSPGQVAVSWGTSTNAASYAVYDATSTGGENTSGAPACTATAPTTTCTVSGLTNGTTYFFVVVASNSTGTTPSTNEMSATPQVAPPGSFSITTATSSPGQVAITWGSATNAASYAVYDATSANGENTSEAPACTATAPTTTCTVNGLTNGTTYFFVVTASDAGGTTQSSNEKSATPHIAPPGSFTITAATGSAGQVAVTWNFASNAASYAVYDATSANGENTSGTPACTTTAPATTCAVSGLINGTTYFFVVTASDAGGTTRSSNQMSATPQAANPPPPPPPPPPTHGYWLVGSDGGIFTFGSAQFYGSTGSLRLQRPVVGIVPTTDRGGYWLDASDGGIFAFGDAGFYGSIPGLGLHPAGSGSPNSLNAPIVGMVPSADGRGYFMVASDGGVFAFGDARFAGSCPGIGGCTGAAVAVMPDASGNGYWLVTQSGHVYTFGDAPYYGAPGPQGSPVTSAVRTPDGHGYWILFAGGGIADYGDAGNFGSPAGQVGGLNPASAIFTTADGGGYWVAAADGAVANYGDAPNDGSMLGTSLNGSIIAATGW